MASVYPSGRAPPARSSQPPPPPPPYGSSSRSHSSQHQPPPPGSQQYPPGPPPGVPPYSSGTSSGYGGHYSGGGGHHHQPQRPSHHDRPPGGGGGGYGNYPPPPPPPSSSSYPAQAPGRNPSSNSSSHPNSGDHHQQHQSHPVKRETEEERRERKKKEYEMRKQRDAKASAHHSQQKQRIEKKPSVVPDKAENRLKRPSTFLCKIKFRNELPDPVSQPKLLRIYNDKDRYSKYSITSMEKTFKHKLYVEPDLGIPLDLLDLSVYNPPKTKAPLDPADAELLVDDEVGVKQKAELARRKERPTDKGVAWLVKTTYISPVSMDPAKQSLTEKQAKELREQKEGRKGPINDRDHQIQAIEETFRVSKMEPVHQTKPELKPVEVLPLLPDFSRCGDQFVHVVFDTEPTGDSELYSKLDRNTRDYLESRAVVKSYSLPKEDGKTEKFLGYMVPKLDEVFFIHSVIFQTCVFCTQAHDDDDEIPYTWIREYQWDVRGEDARNNYVFCFGKDAVQYLPISSKLILHKKKAREGRSKDDVDNQFLVPSSVTVRRRDLTEEEEDQRESMRRIFMDGRLTETAIEEEAPTTKSNKRPMEIERHSTKRRRPSYQEETREASEDEDVSI
ncbi:protein PAF1 homolog isoform X1 [Selaginella moellendorffii]|uniref:protein PAF1 homolog isoform X1 n=1 Tax=Selaginella moellendorffii TaxID=88036 RepID=UPI000D1C2EAF|nr:protein PAF1 homolog isoform X1 [Selaginella moellendorffii]|eukprot:XP_024530396.1 protein PAF1 homolog isoform X1 [Selaginella moellendorffii]